MRADGLRYRAEVTICALLNGNPEPHGYSYVIRDVTRRSCVTKSCAGCA